MNHVKRVTDLEDTDARIIYKLVGMVFELNEYDP